MRHRIENSELMISDDKGQILWRGQPNGMPVREVLTVPHTTDVVVLGDRSRAPVRYQNLLRCSSAGEVVWVAEPLPSVGDSYVAIEISDGRFLVNTWQGFRLEMDLQTGRILSSQFVK